MIHVIDIKYLQPGREEMEKRINFLKNEHWGRGC